MNILAIADHIDPLVYSKNIKKRFASIDLVVSAGDLDLSYYEFIISMLNKPLYFVFGNHNHKNLSRFMSKGFHGASSLNHKNHFGQVFGSICIDGKVVMDKKNNLILAGMGGSQRYNNGMHQFSNWQMFIRILKILPKLTFHRIFHGRWLDILVTHASPDGIHDRDDPCHMGFGVFLWFMQQFKPKLLIHGHVHVYDINAQRGTQFHNTFVVNAYDHIVIDWDNGMQDNNFINQKADQEFSKAKYRAWIQSIWNILNTEANELLSFHDIKNILKPKNQIYRGMQVVEIEDIVGSEDRYEDFSRHFFPKREHLRQRWVNIDKAYLSYVNLPPIKLIKIAGMYFVRDGNHRVSVARSQGVKSIDAEVTELSSEIDIEPGSSRSEITRSIINWEKQNILEQTDIGKIIPVEDIDFTTPGRWYEILNHINGHKYYMDLSRKKPMPFQEALISWHDTLYKPIINIVRKENLCKRFPGRTEADLYLWIVKHWHSLKEKFGQEYPLDQAATEYSREYGKGFWSKTACLLRRIFH